MRGGGLVNVETRGNGRQKEDFEQTGTTKLFEQGRHRRHHVEQEPLTLLMGLLEPVVVPEMGFCSSRVDVRRRSEN